MEESLIAKAFCGRMDHGGCGVLVEIQNDRIKNIKGDPGYPSNLGKLCPKGKATIEVLYHPQRITSPLKRVGPRGNGRWTKVTWKEALDEIASRMKTYRDHFGPQSIAFSQGAPRGLEYLFTYRFAAALGTPNVITTSSVCFVPRWGAGLLTCGFYPKPDIKNSRCVIAWGANHLDTSADSIMGFEVERTIKKGVSLIVVDPRKTRLAAKAELWLRIKPGSDGPLTLAFLHTIIGERLYDESFVAKWTTGFDELKALVADYSPERVSEMTWTPPELIRKAARRYAGVRPASILWGNGLDHNEHSVQTNRLIVNLMAITGNLDILGGNLNCQSPPVMSPEEFVLAKKGKSLRADMIGAEYPIAKKMGFVPSPAAVETLLAEKPYPIKMILAHTTNPLLGYANSRRVFAAFQKLEFLVVTDLFMTPTAALADIVLPPAFNYEFNDLGHYGLPWGRIHARPKLVEPVGQCWSDIKIMNELAKRLGLRDFFWDDVNQCLDHILAPSGHTFESFKEVRVLEATGEERKYRNSGFRTRSGKVDLSPDPMESRLETGLAESPHPLLLTSAKDRAFFHTFLRNISSLRKISPTPNLQLHPELSKRLGLKDGDSAIVETETGSIQLQVKMDEWIDPRVVFVDYGWWFPESNIDQFSIRPPSNTNTLTSDLTSYGSMAGTTTLRGIPCRIKPA